MQPSLRRRYYVYTHAHNQAARALSLCSITADRNGILSRKIDKVWVRLIIPSTPSVCLKEDSG